MPEDPTLTYSYTWFIQRFEQASDEADDLFAHTASHLLTQQPTPDKWSPVECLSHLVSFGNIYSDVINTGIRHAAVGSANDQTSFKPRLFWRWVIHFFEPPYKIGMKTIQSFEPQQTDQPSAEQVLQSFSGLQQHFIEHIRTCEKKGINLSGEKVSHPVVSFLKMTLSECLALTEAHQRRHLWQAQQTIIKLKER